MQNGDEASPSISPAGRYDRLVKMLITLEPHGIHVFVSNFAYLYILTLHSHWCANGVEASPCISPVGHGH